MKPSVKIGVAVGISTVAVGVAVVAGIIFSLQSFDASKVACPDIGAQRTALQSLYDAGVNASVQIYAEEKAAAEEQLSRCLNANPVDPCADAQAVRDAAVANFNGILSPADNASYTDFQAYFQKRDDAYGAYKKAKESLEQCRAENPPPADAPYEQSNTKACFDAYDASLAATQSTFTKDTQTMRTALAAGLAGLDAREKACNPPKGKDAFTDPVGDGESGKTDASENLLSCKIINPDVDPEIAALRARAAAIPGEIQAIVDGIDNVTKRERKLQVDLAEVGTYIPPESTKTQFEGALNALRAERKVNIESALDFYKNLRERRETEKAALERELSDVQAKIQARLDAIADENEARQQKYPTSLRFVGPDKCDFYHCHGLLCGMPDPAQDACGHGATTEDDVDCKKFFNAYLQEAGVN